MLKGTGYTLALTAGEHASLTVDQRGIDVIVQTLGPDGAIAEFEDEIRTDGQEHVDVVADTDGIYTVAIKPAPGTTPPGSYAIGIATRGLAGASDRAVQESRRLRMIAVRFDTQGRFDDARLALERALKAVETSAERDDTQIAAVLSQLAGVYQRLPDRVKSESLYQRAIGIMDRTLGTEHPATALARAQLAELYGNGGERRKAEGLLRQALGVLERTLGVENPWYVSCLATLGNMRDSAGDLAEEEQIVRRALAITEKIEDTDSVQYAALLNNLGEVFRQKQDYVHAEALLKHSLVLTETLLGPESYSLATALQNLGIVARERKDYSTAMAYNLRALSIRERMVGPDHPDVAHILTNVANIYRATGDYRGVRWRHTCELWRASGKTLAGPYQQATPVARVRNIAGTYAAKGDMVNALGYQRRSDAIVEKQPGAEISRSVRNGRSCAFAKERVGAANDPNDLSCTSTKRPDDPDAGAQAMAGAAAAQGSRAGTR